MVHGLDQQKAAVQSGYWPLFRYDPRLSAQGKNPFQLDSRPASIKLKDYVYNETRYTMLAKSNPDEAHRLLDLAQQDVLDRWRIYENMLHMPLNGATAAPAQQEAKQ
jgi:pyruvate-ferredoxin/flavodoxin oxidoreductase